MDKAILISLPVHEFQALIVNSVKSCLQHQPQQVEPTTPENQLLTVDELADFLHCKCNKYKKTIRRSWRF